MEKRDCPVILCICLMVKCLSVLLCRCTTIILMSPLQQVDSNAIQ